MALVCASLLDVSMQEDGLCICSYNIHKGFGLANRRFRLDDMHDAFRNVDAALTASFRRAE